MNGKHKFSYKEFVSSFNYFILDCSGSGKLVPQFFESADIFLQFLYDQNVVCYIETDSDDQQGERFIRWCFRERTLSNLSPKVRTHADYEIFYGLTKALNVGRQIKVKKEAGSRDIGTIIKLNEEGNFGFIRGGPSHAEYYFKYDQIKSAKRSLQVGDKVTFESKVKYGKLRAEIIRTSR